MTTSTTTNLEGITAKRKADRETIAAAMVAIATAHGATVERRDDPANVGYSGPGIVLSVSLAGVGALVDIDDLHERHGSAGGLISWRNTEYPARLFAYPFGRAVRSVRSYPGRHHKASSIGAWQRLAECLDAGLVLAASGEAFEKEDGQ